MTMTYFLSATPNQTIVRLDGLQIPPDPANTDFAAYLAWLEAGNTPDPAPTPEPPVPLTPAEKLAQSGLSVLELKELLGL